MTLIKRKDAIETVHKHFTDALNDLPTKTDEDGDVIYKDTKSVNELLKHNKAISKALKALPSADAVQGEWVDEDGNNVPLHKDGYPLRSCYCNQCHEWLVASDEYEVKGNFCPNCGARMKGGAE